MPGGLLLECLAGKTKGVTAALDMVGADYKLDDTMFLQQRGGEVLFIEKIFVISLKFGWFDIIS